MLPDGWAHRRPSPIRRLTIGEAAYGKWTRNHDTLIAVGNAGNTASKAQITFYFNSGQGKYQIEQTLVPDEQAWLDVGKLIRNQVPDVNGATMPLTEMSGGYELKSLTDKPTDGLFEGKLVVDKTYGYAVHGCLQCCPEYSRFYLVQDPLNLTTGGSSTQTVWGHDACTLQNVQLSGSNWDTGNHQIATANASSGLITAVGAGSTTNFTSVVVSAPNPKGYCGWTTEKPTGTLNVQVPTSLKVISYPTISLTSAGCLATDYGMAIAITYQVLDQNNLPLQSSNMEPQEKILNDVFNGNNFGNPYPNWVDIYNANYPGSTKYTNTSGQFLDAPFAACANVPFTETLTQPISMLMNGVNYTVRTNNWKTVTVVPGGHGTMSNGSDIKASN